MLTRDNGRHHGHTVVVYSDIGNDGRQPLTDRYASNRPRQAGAEEEIIRWHDNADDDAGRYSLVGSHAARRENLTGWHRSDATVTFMGTVHGIPGTFSCKGNCDVYALQRATRTARLTLPGGCTMAALAGYLDLRARPGRRSLHGRYDLPHLRLVAGQGCGRQSRRLRASPGYGAGHDEECLATAVLPPRGGTVAVRKVPEGHRHLQGRGGWQVRHSASTDCRHVPTRAATSPPCHPDGGFRC